MTAISDLIEKIATARAMPEGFGMVVLTADEAQAIVDEVAPAVVTVNLGELNAYELRELFKSGPPGGGRLVRMDEPNDDEVV